MKKLKKIKYLKNEKKLLFDQFILINTKIGDFFKILNVFKQTDTVYHYRGGAGRGGNIQINV